MEKKNQITIEQLVLFVLNNSKPNMGIKKLNKLAFLTEFTYIFEKETPLTQANYAAIDMGPVINNYKALVKRLIKEKKIEKNNQVSQGLEDYLPKAKDGITDPDLIGLLRLILQRYENLNAKQLEALTHDLDSYNITVHENGGRMGAVIDKDLAFLDSSLSLTEI